MSTYTAIASRDGRWWLVRIPGIGNDPDDGLYTQAHNLAEVEPMARDLIALWLDAPADSFDVEVQVELPEAVQHHLELSAKLRQEAAASQAAAADEYRRAAIELKEIGLTVRDIGAALGISHQRVQQLVTSAAAPVMLTMATPVGRRK